jgi:hypothetical protein
MAITHGAATRNSIADAVLAAVDAGAAAAKMKFYDAADVLLMTVTLEDPAGAVTDEDLDFTAPVYGDVATAGTCTKFSVTDSDDNVIFNGTCGAGAGDLSFDDNVWGLNDRVEITTAVYTAPV